MFDFMTLVSECDRNIWEAVIDRRLTKITNRVATIIAIHYMRGYIYMYIGGILQWLILIRTNWYIYKKEHCLSILLVFLYIRQSG